MTRTSDVDEPDRISAEAFRAIMGRFATGVHVITTRDGAATYGMTATAVCAVSAEPPSLLAVVNRSNRTHPVLSSSGVFAVHMLSDEQEGVATHFASKPSEPFAGIAHRIERTGCPIITGAYAFAECIVAERTDFGTHTIFVGEIVASSFDDRAPLLYHRGRFAALRDDVPA